MYRRSIGLLALALACSSSEDGASPPLTGRAGTTGDAAPRSILDAGGLPGITPPRTDEDGPRPDGLDRPEPADAPSSGAADAALLPDEGNDLPDAGPVCPRSGAVRYTLARSMTPTPDERDAYDRITQAMDAALVFYNC